MPDAPSLSKILEVQRDPEAVGLDTPYHKGEYVRKWNGKAVTCIGTRGDMRDQNADGQVEVVLQIDGSNWIAVLDGAAYQTNLRAWNAGDLLSFDGTLNWGGFDETPKVLVTRIRNG